VLWPGFGSLASAFIPDVKTFVIDLHREPGLKDYAVGSALSLPFSDRSFEFVLAADTLEHIPAADRQSFLHELLRVARGAVLLSFPFRTPLNEACERLVYRYIQMRKQSNCRLSESTWNWVCRRSKRSANGSRKQDSLSGSGTTAIPCSGSA